MPEIVPAGDLPRENRMERAIATQHRTQLALAIRDTLVDAAGEVVTAAEVVVASEGVARPGHTFPLLDVIGDGAVLVDDPQAPAPGILDLSDVDEVFLAVVGIADEGVPQDDADQRIGRRGSQ